MREVLAAVPSLTGPAKQHEVTPSRKVAPKALIFAVRSEASGAVVNGVHSPSGAHSPVDPFLMAEIVLIR